jgi:hypothetical protein
MNMANKYEQKKYSLGIAEQTTRHHPGYSAEYSAAENVRIGRRTGRSYEHVAKELQAIANLTHKKVFARAAEEARKRERG